VMIPVTLQISTSALQTRLAFSETAATFLGRRVGGGLRILSL
jgi:hypothetical protein